MKDEKKVDFEHLSNIKFHYNRIPPLIDPMYLKCVPFEIGIVKVFLGRMRSKKNKKIHTSFLV